jgi:hypothetical protein
MSEVLVSLIVFAIAVVGLVAVESRGIEAQRASMELRGGERIAQEVMQELMSTSYDQLVERDFSNGLAPAFPYSDVDLDTWTVRDFGGVPLQSPGGNNRPGVRRGFYWVGRSIAVVPVTAVPNGDPKLADALQLEVTVLWLDYTNPAFPPPATDKVQDLRPENLIPGHAAYKPWVSGVQLRTVRVNDGAPIVEVP